LAKKCILNSLDHKTTICGQHLLDTIICFEHIQILTQLVWHLTTNHQLDGRCVSLYILIFSILISQLALRQAKHCVIIRSPAFGL